MFKGKICKYTRDVNQFKIVELNAKYANSLIALMSH